jgi:hypothetical protein
MQSLIYVYLELENQQMHKQAVSEKFQWMHEYLSIGIFEISGTFCTYLCLCTIHILWTGLKYCNRQTLAGT